MPTLEQMKLWNDMVELHEKMLMGVSVSDDSAIPTGIIKKSRFGYHIELFSADKWSKVRGGRWALTKAGALRMVRRWAETLPESTGSSSTTCFPAPHPEPLEGYLVRGREVLTALMVWESPVDEPPSVSAGYETYSLPYWRGRGWQWYNKHPRDDADPSDSDLEEPL